VGTLPVSLQEIAVLPSVTTTLMTAEAVPSALPGQIFTETVYGDEITITETNPGNGVLVTTEAERPVEYTFTVVSTDYGIFTSVAGLKVASGYPQSGEIVEIATNGVGDVTRAVVTAPLDVLNTNAPLTTGGPDSVPNVFVVDALTSSTPSPTDLPFSIAGTISAHDSFYSSGTVSPLPLSSTMHNQATYDYGPPGIFPVVVPILMLI